MKFRWTLIKNFSVSLQSPHREVLPTVEYKFTCVNKMMQNELYLLYTEQAYNAE